MKLLRPVSILIAFCMLTLGAFVALGQPPADNEGTSRAWERFREHFDADGDGTVTRDEFEAAADPFARHDKDGDGVLTAADFPARDRAAFRTRRLGGGLARLADGDRDREVTTSEWQTLLAALDEDGDGTFTGDDFRRVLMAQRENAGPEDGERRMRPRGPRGPGGPGGPGCPGGMACGLDHDGDGTLETADLDALFAELDADGDGTLSEDELPRMRHRHRGPRHGRGFGGPGGGF